MLQNIPPHSLWVEAFCGSAAMTLAKPPSDIEVINDIDHDIVNVFKQLRDNTDNLCKVLELTPYAREELANARIDRENESDLELARKFLVKAMFAINNAFGNAKGGFSVSDSYSRQGKEARVNRWLNLPDKIALVARRLKDIRIENMEAIKLIKSYKDRPNTLIYLDPPYLGDRNLGYQNEANDENYHQKLLETINKSKCMIFISGYRHALYDQILSERNGWVSRTIKATTRNEKGTIFDRDEVVWYNKVYKQAQESQSLPATLTQKEAIDKKVNPKRE